MLLDVAAIIMAQSQLEEFMQSGTIYGKAFYEILNGLLQQNRQKRWDIDTLVEYLSAIKSNKSKYISRFEEIEDMKRQLQEELTSADINSLLCSDKLPVEDMTQDQIHKILYIKNLEAKQYFCN